MNTADRSLEELTQTELFQKINEICYTVNTAADVIQMLDVSLSKIMGLFNAERGSVFLFKDISGQLILEASRGMAVQEEQALVKKLGEGIVGQVAQSKQPIIVEDIARDERFSHLSPRTSYKTASFICAPMLIKDQLIGVINITDKVSGSRFGRTELQLLDFLAAQIALNVRRMEIYQRFSMIVKESETLRDRLGKSSQEADALKKKVVVQERLASIGKLAGGIAHEFNNPLDGVMRYTNLCLEHIGENDVLRGYLLEVKHGLNRMAGIVRNLLACSRSPMPTQTEIDIHQALEQAVYYCQDRLLGKDIVLEKDFFKKPIFLIDMGLERVFANILQNAIDAIEQEGVIHLVTRIEDSQAVISVQDDGCGIPENKIEKIFEPFYTTKDIEKGCGLGLTIVDEIVKSYKGRIEIKPLAQGGTIVNVFLPLQQT